MQWVQLESHFSKLSLYFENFRKTEEQPKNNGKITKTTVFNQIEFSFL